jgi:neutral ceramidase
VKLRGILCILAICVLAPTVEAADAPWKAGCARAKITPDQFMWMSGYGSRDKPASGKINDLWAKAVAIQDPSGHKVVLITLDLVGIDRATSVAVCERIQQDLGLDRSQVAISTSHTHSGPVVGTNLMAMYSLDEKQRAQVANYTNQLIDQLVKLAADAVSSLKPAVLKTGEGHATFAVNRRNNREADVPMLRENGLLVGPVDHSVPVLAVRDPNGKLLTVVFGYACHATVMSGMEWCSDWPGFAQEEIEKNHPGVQAMFWAGCGADQNPLPRRTVELAQEYGRQTAASVDRTLKSPMRPVTGSLKSVYREIPIALDRIPTKEQIEAELKSDNVFLVRRAEWLMKTVARDGSLSPTYPYPVQMWAIGNHVNLTFLGGEVVVDYSLRLRDELPGASNWISGYSNDVMAYIPSRRVLMEGGYEGETSMIYYGLPSKWAPAVEEDIVKTVHELHSQLRPPASPVQ